MFALVMEHHLSNYSPGKCLASYYSFGMEYLMIPPPGTVSFSHGQLRRVMSRLIEIMFYRGVLENGMFRAVLCAGDPNMVV